MKKLIKNVFLLFLITVIISSVFSVPASAETVLTADIDFYKVNYDEVIQRTPYILNDGNWKKMISVAKAKNGVRIELTEAVKNIRVEAPPEVNMDGFHTVFSGLEGAQNSKLGFVFTQRKGYSAIFDQNVIDLLAWIPLAFILDTNAGTLTVRQGKAYHNSDNNINNFTIITSDNLKMANLRGKEWSFSLKLDVKDEANENDDVWKVSIAGESAIIENSKLFAVSSEIEYKNTYFALNCASETNNNFSLNWHTVHSGEATCADDPNSKKLLDAAKEVINKIDSVGEVTYEKGGLISEIRSTYDNMPYAMQSLIKNYETFCIKENAYSFVKRIAELEKVSLNSKEELFQIDDTFAKLSDEEKLNVTNYSDFVEYKKKYLEMATESILSEPYVIEKEVPAKSGSHTEITKTVDVEGETITKKITDTITTSGMDGTQYLWIIFTATGVILLGIASVFAVLFLKNRKRRMTNV